MKLNVKNFAKKSASKETGKSKTKFSEVSVANFAKSVEVGSIVGVQTEKMDYVHHGKVLSIEKTLDKKDEKILVFNSYTGKGLYFSGQTLASAKTLEIGK